MRSYGCRSCHTDPAHWTHAPQTLLVAAYIVWRVFALSFKPETRWTFERTENPRTKQQSSQQRRMETTAAQCWWWRRDGIEFYFFLFKFTIRSYTWECDVCVCLCVCSRRAFRIILLLFFYLKFIVVLFRFFPFLLDFHSFFFFFIYCLHLNTCTSHWRAQARASEWARARARRVTVCTMRLTGSLIRFPSLGVCSFFSFIAHNNVVAVWYCWNGLLLSANYMYEMWMWKSNI